MLIGASPLLDIGETSEPMPDPARARAALEMGTALHDLALSYWTRGRPDDASRVCQQAVRILERHCPGSARLGEVGSTLRRIERETSLTNA